MSSRPRVRRSERRIFLRCILIGLAVTLTVAALEQLGSLQRLEDILSDERVVHCQRYVSTQPSQVMHVDLDDPSMDEIGHWPWKRSVLADAIGELDRAGARFIALDILLDKDPDPQHRADDEKLIAAIKKSDRVLLPISLPFTGSGDRSKLSKEVEAALSKAPEQSLDELVANIGQLTHRPPADVRGDVESAYLEALQRALLDRIDLEFPGALPSEAEVAKHITPIAIANNQRSSPREKLTAAYEELSATRAAGRSAISNVRVPLIEPGADTLPPSEFLNAAASTGFMDFIPSADGAVRSIPLLSRFRGKVYPHMALAVACAAVGVDPRQLIVGNGWIVSDQSAHPAIKIPIRQAQSAKYGAVGALTDVPWQGKRNDWLTMYDAPTYSRPMQHVSFRDLYAITRQEESIASNEAFLHDRLIHVLSMTKGGEKDQIAEYDHEWQTMNWEQRKARINQTLTDAITRRRLQRIRPTDPALGHLEAETINHLEDLKDSINGFRPMHSQPRDDASDILRGALFLESIPVLKQLPAINDRLRDEVDRLRASLKHDIDGHVVLMGWVATGATDQYKTSLNAMCPGIVIQGTVVHGILTGHLQRHARDQVNWLQTLLAGAIASLIGAYFRPTAALAIIAPMLVGYLVINGFVLFDATGVIIPAAGVTVVLAALWITLTLYRFISESAERTRITRRLRSNIDPRIVDYFIENPELSAMRGERREMTVVFTDLQGFSRLSEQLKEEVIPIINEYMGRMLPIIRANEGTWDKFIGDGIMFFFNAPELTPNHASKAVAAVLQMQSETERLSQELQNRSLPPVSMRAGVCTGMMIVGDAGSLNKNFYASSYTVLGDLVNLASRLEGANKLFGTSSMVIGETMSAATDFLFRPIGKVRVYGKDLAAEVYEPIAPRASATAQQLRLAELSTQAVRLFREHRWYPCLELITQIESEFGASLLWDFYRDRIDEELRQPSPRFDDAFNLSVK